MGRWFRRAGIALVAVLLLVSGGFFAWTRIARYPAFSEATTIAQNATTDRGWYVFEPTGTPRAGLVFYPGGLVDPAAYAPLMKRLSDRGVLAVIVPMPLDLAVFDFMAADEVVAAYPNVHTWVIGGHSLGGAMAAEYLKRKPDTFAGVVFLASYPAESTDLSAIPAKVVSIHGTEDGVAGDVFEKSLDRLPAGTDLVTIAGGNHAQFGYYGPQKGDGTATVSREAQQQQTADAIMRLVGSLP